LSAALAAAIEHTLLRADASRADVERACAEAARWGCFGVCVQPDRVSVLRDATVPVVTVVGFPFGADLSDVKAAAARRARKDGAAEIDMVIRIGAVKDGDWAAVEGDVAWVREAAGALKLKVILETGCLTEPELREAARIAMKEGADFLKTCTGYGPRGATLDDVKLLAEYGPVKAAGGIRTREQAEAFLAAGASRIGTSATRAILGHEAED
jgi:deoxyribose-phosphate aldolase